MPSPEDDLFARARAGDQQALGELLHRNVERARRELAGQIPARWQSMLSEEDVLQQTFADAIADFGAFRSPPEAFSAWLARIASRNLLDAIRLLETSKRGGDRRRVQGPVGTQDDPGGQLYDWIASTGTTPSGCLARQDVKAAVDRALRRMPEMYANVIRMCDLENRPVSEVARAIGRSPGAVHMLRARAHEQLATILGTPSSFLTMNR